MKPSFDFESWIGARVTKISGKPFSSGQKVARVTGVCLLVIGEVKRTCFTFERDRVVECHRCKRVGDSG